MVTRQFSTNPPLGSISFKTGPTSKGVNPTFSPNPFFFPSQHSLLTLSTNLCSIYWRMPSQVPRGRPAHFPCRHLETTNRQSPIPTLNRSAGSIKYCTVLLFLVAESQWYDLGENAGSPSGIMMQRSPLQRGIVSKCLRGRSVFEIRPCYEAHNNKKAQYSGGWWYEYVEYYAFLGGTKRRGNPKGRILLCSPRA